MADLGKAAEEPGPMEENLTRTHTEICVHGERAKHGGETGQD